MKRVFIAIKINPSKILLELIGSLKLTFKDERIRWVDKENMHLTIAFLGDRDKDELGHITGLLKSICKLHDPFKLHLGGLGVFRNFKTPRVIWLGVFNPLALETLAGSIRGRLKESALFDEDKLFRPHLTLGRMKRIEERSLLADQIDKYHNTFIQQEEINKIILYESILKPSGAEYHILEEFKLDKG